MLQGTQAYGQPNSGGYWGRYCELQHKGRLVFELSVENAEIMWTCPWKKWRFYILRWNMVTHLAIRGADERSQGRRCYDLNESGETACDECRWAEFVFKMMNFVFKMIDFAFKMMDSCDKTTISDWQMRICYWKMMICLSNRSRYLAGCRRWWYKIHRF